MDYFDLKIFTTIADTGSYEKAAPFLSMSPTAVLKHLRKLEKETRLTLFDRSGRRLRLTAAGASLHESTPTLLAELAGACSAVSPVPSVISPSAAGSEPGESLFTPPRNITKHF